MIEGILVAVFVSAVLGIIAMFRKSFRRENEIAQLKQRIADLEKEIVALESENFRLKETIIGLQSETLALKSENLELKRAEPAPAAQTVHVNRGDRGVLM